MVKLDYVYEFTNPKHSGKGGLTFLDQVSFLHKNDTWSVLPKK